MSRSRTPAAASREIDVTSYAELVLAPQAADVAHPAFSKLFVETEYLAEVGAILATRRRRVADASRKSGLRTSPSSTASAVGKPEFETDRARFLGRGGSVRTADRGDRRTAALEHGRHRARSGLRPAPACADRAWRDRAHCLLDGGRIISRGAARPHRQASRHHRLRAGGHSGLDPGAGAAPSPRNRSGRGRAMFQRLAGHLLYCSADLAALLRRHPSRRRRAVGALAH